MSLKDLKIFAIVVTFNGQQWIRKCLNSLESSELPVQVIVIDNYSKDNTAQIIEHEYPKVELIKSEKNLGFGKGNNIGLRMALAKKVDYIFLLNQDAWVEKNTLEELIIQQKKNPDYGIISPIHLNGDGTSLEYKFAEYISPFFTNDIVSDFFLNNSKEIYLTKFINAAAWLISKECLLKTGGFDPIFPHYGEDEDYVQRVHLNGFKVGIVTTTTVCHDNNFSYENVDWNFQRQLISSILQLKNLESPYRRNLLIFIKSNLDQVTSLLLFRRFKQMWFRLKIMTTTFKLLKRIKKSRKASLLNQAFLDVQQ